ncbi:VOC family protein [Polyangium sorediatum]|uniref:VOC family protein n=1 Tax=Polyangium sorediatum TaxID=889274 RepID=A0ABT6NPV6_9BACT|nr:VOC family protein [Polyangium sorediatum]MDI1430362.1 VOC family protein [Polyangium sorediatum]
MAVQFNHTIVLSRDREKSAHFLADILGLVVAKPFGPFLPVATTNGVTLDFMTVGTNIAIQHYAFLVSEEEFDPILARLVQQKVPIWADPHGQHPGRINRNDGGRGVYFFDPSGHGMEAFTRPYGSNPSSELNGVTEEVPGAAASNEFPR